MLLTSLASFLVSFVPFLSGNRPPLQEASDSPQPLTFELRHLHAVSSERTHVILSDVPPQARYSFSDATGSTKPLYTIQPRRVKTVRPSSIEAHSRSRLRSLRYGESEWLDWDEEEILGPNVESRETLLELAKMTNNAYVAPSDPAWYDLGTGWNSVRIVCCSLNFELG